MDREERDKLERLAVEALRGSNDEVMWEYARAVLDAVLPAYDAVRDAEWEQLGFVRVYGGGEALVRLSVAVQRSREDYPPIGAGVFVRRVGKEGGS